MAQTSSASSAKASFAPVFIELSMTLKNIFNSTTLKMNTDLMDKNLLPSESPYNSQVTMGENCKHIVQWVHFEVGTRKGNKLLSSFDGLLTSEGRIIAPSCNETGFTTVIKSDQLLSMIVFIPGYLKFKVNLPATDPTKPRKITMDFSKNIHGVAPYLNENNALVSAFIQIPGTNYYSPRVGDVNADGVIDIKDSHEILAVLGGADFTATKVLMYSPADLGYDGMVSYVGRANDNVKLMEALGISGDVWKKSIRYLGESFR